jgi:hypothetical protein
VEKILDRPQNEQSTPMIELLLLMQLSQSSIAQGKAPDLNDVTAFVAAAKSVTLSGAARDMGLPTSTVSGALTRLEEHVGILLIRRSQRGLGLTDAGKEYLTSCGRALRSLLEGSELVERQRVNPSGLLRVAAPVCFAKNTLAPLLATQELLCGFEMKYCGCFSCA